MSPEVYGPEGTPQQPGSGQPPEGLGPGTPPAPDYGAGPQPPTGPQPPAGYQQPPSYPPPGAPQGYPPPEPGRDRRPEKQDEKQNEKQQEKGQSLDEKYKRNPLGILSLAFLIIWLGVMLLLMNTGVIEEDDQGWAIFAWGGAVIIFVEAFLRLAVPKWRRSVMGSFIWGAVWAGVGFGLWFDRWEVIGPLVVIAIGVALLLGRLIPRN